MPRGTFSFAFISQLSVLCTILSVSGCDRPGPKQEILKTVPVSGTLTYQGKPLGQHSVMFNPVDGQRPAIGRTNADGEFTLGTNAVHDGAVIGKHQVTIVFDPEVDTVNPGKSAPKPSVVISKNYALPEKSGIEFDVPAAGLVDLQIDLK